MMKSIIYSVIFLIFAATVIIVGDHYYDVYHSSLESVSLSESSKSDDEIHTTEVVKGHPPTFSGKSITLPTSSPVFPYGNIPTTSLTLMESKQSPHFSAGFDWTLPTNTKITNYSGLISGEGTNTEVVNNRFIIVLWDETNPRQGQYDFSKLKAHLKRIAPQQVLIRLEVNSSCEAPKWALNQLRRTKHKSLIYWDKSYMDLTRSYIQNFAKQFAANPQIIGVQLGLADGEFGEAPDSCDDYDNKQGWGEFWMSPAERQEAESEFGFTPEVFEKATIANIDIYANAFGEYKNKLAFTNIGTLFTYGKGSEPYNQNLKTIAQYALKNGLGNRDGAIERWMSYTDKVYGSVFTTMSDGSCLLDMDEQYMRKLKGRYWGTENEFYGNKDYVTSSMGPYENHPYRFLISSLRTLQMRRNFMSISNMREMNHVDYKIPEFLKYLSLTMGKQIEDTPDAFVLMGERYIDPSRLTDQMDVACVKNNKKSVAVRSFGRWLTESPQNTQIENKPALKVQMPKSENYWYQSFYLPEGIDYEYFAREATQFSFNLNDELSLKRCKNGCEVEVKATFKDSVKTSLQIQVAEGVSESLQTMGDNKIKTASFKINSKFANQLQVSSSDSNSDLNLISENLAIPLILLRINFLN